MSNIYGIINKRNLRIIPGENTTKSRYLIASRDLTSFDWDPSKFPIKRKLSSRSLARSYKRGLHNPQNWAIVDLRTGEAVR